MADNEWGDDGSGYVPAATLIERGVLRMVRDPAPEVFELDVPMMYAPKAQRHTSPQPCEPLNANMRLHWRPERERKKTVRDAIHYAAKKIGPARHITVQLRYRPGDNRRRDGSNLMPTQKPAVDGLVRAGIVPDDTAEYVTEHTPVIDTGPGPRRLWLTVEVQR